LADPLPHDIASAIDGSDRLSGGAHLEYHAEVTSTNDIALAKAAAGAPEGYAVLADQQRAGRGRRGRVWFSPPGAGLYLSVVTRPPTARLSLVTLVAGIAAARAVTDVTGLPVRLKWPNDLMVGRPWMKLGGVLCEAAGLPDDGAAAVVIGTGINLRPAAYPPDVGDLATSIEGELARAADRGALTAELLANVRDGVRRLRDEPDVAWVRDAWRALAADGAFGAAVRWRDGDDERRGIARDIDEDGALVVEAGQTTARIIAGEVIWERPS